MSLYNKDSLVVKSNKVIQARYKLTVLEQKIIIFLTSLIKKEDEEFKTYRLRVKDLAGFLGIRGKYIYEQLEQSTASLISRVIKIENEKTLLQLSWLSSAEYHKGEGYVDLCFDPKLKPYLLNLKTHFTMYKLKNVIQFKSIYSFRIYELLKQFESIGIRKLSLDQLKEIMELSPTQYYKYSAFKRYVLLVAQKELEEHADITFTFREIKTGRSITDIEFTIIQANQPLPFPADQQGGQGEPGEEKDFEKYVKKLVEYGIKGTKALNLLIQQTEDRIIRNVDHFEKVRTWKTDLKNPAGWLYKAILEDYAALSPQEQEEEKKKKRDNKKAKVHRIARELFESIHGDFKEARDKKLVALFTELPDDKKDEHRTSYIYTAPAVVKKHFKKIGLDKIISQPAFIDYLRRRTHLLKDEESFKTYAENKGYRLEEDERGFTLLFKIDEKDRAT